MTETDKIYLAVVETMKKYGFEQVSAALEQYITTGNNRYFTSTNGARAAISELTPAQVLSNALKSTLKCEIIQRGHAQVLPNYTKVNKALDEYLSGKKISVDLSTTDFDEVMIKLIKADVGSAVNLLAIDNNLFQTFLEGYTIKIGNYRQELNKISDDEFPMIDEYFEQFENENDRQR